jgi:hypothetical protein
MEREGNLPFKLRDAASRRERDFISLFNALWYRDFPFVRGREPKTVRAMYTAHINTIVKSCADLMGFFTLFEQGTRTDIIIHKASKQILAKVELEWMQPFREKFNELDKLSAAAKKNEADTFILITYSESRFLLKNLAKIKQKWPHKAKNLLLFLVQFSQNGRKRQFLTLQTYRVKSGKAIKVREQYALPWEVPGTRWQPTEAKDVDACSAAEQNP